MAFKTIEEIKQVEYEYKEKLETFAEEWQYINIDEIKSGYKISNHGRIMNPNGKIMSLYSKDLYLYIKLITNEGTRKSYQVHRLVAKIFIDIPKKYIDNGYTYETLQVNHINGIRYCNAVFNLEWCTPKENTEHAHRVGLAWKLHGENNSNSVISTDDVHKICKYLEEGKSNAYIKNHINVSDSVIHSIRSGENWKSTTSQYKFAQRINSIDDETIHDICKDIASGNFSGNEIARKYGVSNTYIQQLRRKEFRPDITSQYDFSKYVIKEQISDEIIHNICKDIESNLSTTQISKKYNLSKSYINDIKHHRKRVDITKNYNF